GGRVLARAGATPMVLGIGDALPALERGVIDAVEFVGPHDDLNLGLYRGARYYYYPGWHEFGTNNEFTFNRKAYETLPADLRHALDYSATAVGALVLAEYEAKNALALRRLRTEFKDRVEILAFPAPILKELKRLAGEVLREESEKSPMARKVHASYAKFQALVQDWGQISEGAYHKLP
ncbi:MAG: ABC transporter substrate-binding protein, partial [Candidatus Rokuibacteriota bacterium]